MNNLTDTQVSMAADSSQSLD